MFSVKFGNKSNVVIVIYCLFDKEKYYLELRDAYSINKVVKCSIF
jgi:hypothetical protein